jgi:trimeric autotransporter adhesin
MRQLRGLWLAGVCAVILFARVSNAQEPAAVARVAVATPSAGAQETVPRLVQFSGTLKDAAARPVSGVASVTFAIYAEQEGGAALWSETQNVLADSSGHYSVLLGAATASGVPAELFGTGQSRWLGVAVARQPELPRVLLASVPYALKAGDADTLGGLPASAYVTTQNLAALNAHPATTVVSGGTSIIAAGAGAAQLGANSAEAGAGIPSANASSGEIGGATGDAAPNSVTQAAVTGTGTAQFVPLWTSGSNLGSSKIYQAAGGFVGINTTTPLLQLDVNGNSIFRGSFQVAPQGTATASSGQPSHSFQWQASAFNSDTSKAVNVAYGFRAVPQFNNSGSPTASLDLFYGPGGGTLTDLGLSIDNAGEITFVPTQTFNGQSIVITGNLGLNSGSGITIGGYPYMSTNLTQYPNSRSIGFGLLALNPNSSGQENTAFGGDALVYDTSGDYNTAVGTSALQDVTTGSDNTATGALALAAKQTGNGDTALGYDTGDGDATGSYNTYLGWGAVATADPLTNATAVGAFATVGESNAVVLGSVKGLNSYGYSVNVGIGSTKPAYTLEVIDSNNGPGTSAIFGTTSYAGHNAVFGASTATSGGSNGGFFTTASPSGAGIVATNSGGGLVASLQGNVQITGTLTKGGGSFKIDDPIDPAGKYLSHSFVESPDMMNIYNGNVVTDAKGFATVTMPAWFEALNRDFRYQLTTMGQFAQAMVAKEIEDGQFTIQTDKPNVKVSWMVTGIRHDAWANAHRIPNEEEKPVDEQGYYLHPELFGAGPEKSVAAKGTAVVGAVANVAAELRATSAHSSTPAANDAKGH